MRLRGSEGRKQHSTDNNTMIDSKGCPSLVISTAMAHHTGHVSGFRENDGDSFLQPLRHLRDLGMDLLPALPYSGRKKEKTCHHPFALPRSVPFGVHHVHPLGEPGIQFGLCGQRYFHPVAPLQKICVAARYLFRIVPLTDRSSRKLFDPRKCPFSLTSSRRIRSRVRLCFRSLRCQAFCRKC